MPIIYVITLSSRGIKYSFLCEFRKMYNDSLNIHSQAATADTIAPDIATIANKVRYAPVQLRAPSSELIIFHQ